VAEHGADVNAKDNYGMTPLHIASRKGHIDVVKLLGGLGADIDPRNDLNETPLHFAAGNG